MKASVFFFDQNMKNFSFSFLCYAYFFVILVCLFQFFLSPFASYSPDFAREFVFPDRKSLPATRTHNHAKPEKIDNNNNNQELERRKEKWRSSPFLFSTSLLLIMKHFVLVSCNDKGNLQCFKWGWGGQVFHRDKKKF